MGLYASSVFESTAEAKIAALSARACLPREDGIDIEIDEQDEDLRLLRWHQAYGYAKTAVFALGVYRTVPAHRLVLRRMLGRDLKEGEVCDHIDGDTWNNHRDNLRVASFSGNMQNRKRTWGVSGYFGVLKLKSGSRKNPWQMLIKTRTENGELKILRSYHATPEEAALAYNAAAEKHGFLTRNVIRPSSPIETPPAPTWAQPDMV